MLGRYLIRSPGSLFHVLRENYCAAIERLEKLDYGAENRREVEELGPTTQKLFQPTSKWVPFSNPGSIRQRKDKLGSAFHRPCPIYNGSLTPAAPTATKLWEAFTFYGYYFRYPGF